MMHFLVASLLEDKKSRHCKLNDRQIFHCHLKCRKKLPRMGSKATGKSDVTAKGSASVTQKVAMITMT